MLCNAFRKAALPARVPAGLQAIIRQVKRCSTKEAALRRAYGLLTRRYHGARLQTYLLLHRAFTCDLDRIWRRTGYLHCTQLTYLLRTVLIKSGLFTEHDVRQRWTAVWLISPHQYLRVRTGSGWIDVDPWAHRFGIAFGSHAGF